MIKCTYLRSVLNSIFSARHTFLKNRCQTMPEELILGQNSGQLGFEVVKKSIRDFVLVFLLNVF